MVVGYSVFANGGYRVTPYFIDRIEDAQGTVLGKANPVSVGKGAERVIDARNAFIMTNMMQDVIRGGTGRARHGARPDRSGRQDRHDQRADGCLVCRLPAAPGAVVWIGFDIPRTLGDRETGAVAALPIWMAYMGNVLEGPARGTADRARRRGRPWPSIRKPGCATSMRHRR